MLVNFNINEQSNYLLKNSDYSPKTSTKSEFKANSNFVCANFNDHLVKLNKVSFRSNLSEKLLKDTLQDIKSLGVKRASITISSPFGTINESTTGINDSNKYGIGSITKTFTSVLVLKLQEMGKLNIDDKIIDYLPELKGNLPNIGNITIRQLLNHSSGLPDYMNGRQFPKIFEFIKDEKPHSADEYLDYLKEAPSTIEPFDSKIYNKDNYSNTNYLILGKLIEKNEQKPLPQVYHELLFKKADIRTSTKLGMSDHWCPCLKSGFADGGIISTSEDLALFFKKLFIDKEILNQKSIDIMCNEGLGLIKSNINGKVVYGHAGEIPECFRSELLYLPEKNQILTVLTDYTDVTDSKVSKGLEPLIVKSFI